MNVNVSPYITAGLDIGRPELNSVEPVDIQQDFRLNLFSAVQRAASKFIYEPATDETLSRIKDSIASVMHGYCGGGVVKNVEIDDSRDLETKMRECRECAEASSYEEYKIKRAVANLPDEAGSEREWTRMSQYSPGRVNVYVDFISPQPAQTVEYTFKIC